MLQERVAVVQRHLVAAGCHLEDFWEQRLELRPGFDFCCVRVCCDLRFCDVSGNKIQNENFTIMKTQKKRKP